jgi:hypothetical protein
MRYYCAAGAGGVAVAVHTTQFAIRKPEFNITGSPNYAMHNSGCLFESVLSTCAEAIDICSRTAMRPVVKIAGIVGRTPQALREAELAVSYGYHAGLLSLSAFRDGTVDEMIDHANAVSEVIPLFGFYLQPSVGGRILPLVFWRQFVRIPNVVAIKIAPFNRYHTLDVVRAVAEECRENEIALYTGNDDAIILDLITPYRFADGVGEKVLRIRGGLLGQWAVGTKHAVELLDAIHLLMESGSDIPQSLLIRNVELTDINAALFDAAHQFAGVIPGVHEILCRQGLLEGTWTLDPEERLSPGQLEEIDRVYRAYPRLFDDEFVRDHAHEWL